MNSTLTVYFKIFLNFIKTHRLQTVFATGFAVLLSFLVQESLSTQIKEIPPHIQVLLIAAVAFYATWKILVLTSADQIDLRLNFLSLSSYFKLRFAQTLIVGTSCVLTSLFVYIWTGHIDVEQGLMLLSTLVSAAFIFPLLLFAAKKTNANKAKLYSYFYLSTDRFLGTKNLISFWLTTSARIESRKIIILLLTILASGTLGFIAPANNESARNLLLLFLPLGLLLLASLDFNCESYKDSRRYLQNLRLLFLVDFLMWLSALAAFLLLIFILNLVLNLGLELSPWLIAILPFVLFYFQLIKFHFIERKFIKALTLALSIGLPFMIPLFAFISLRSLYRD